MRNLPHQMPETCYPETSKVTRRASCDTTDVTDTECSKYGRPVFCQFPQLSSLTLGTRFRAQEAHARSPGWVDDVALRVGFGVIQDYSTPAQEVCGQPRGGNRAIR